MVDENIIPLPTSSKIEEEASVWVMRFSDGGATDADREEFLNWVNQSSLHQSTYNKLTKFWGGLDFVEELNDFAESDTARASLRQEKTANMFRMAKPVVMTAMAASFAVLCVFASVQMGKASPSFYATYETSVGQQETIVLPDGSNIILNTGSALEVEFTATTRDISLTQGEAFFEVAHDKTRPFSVRTPKGVVTAVGTAFSVRMNAEKLNVIVTEGRVALNPSALSESQDTVNSPQSMEITAGQSAIIDRGVENVSLMKSANLQKTLDWHDGELSFKGETLEEVIADIERYTDVKIKFGDDELRQQKIVAYYKVGDIDRMFEALNVMAGIEVTYTSENQVTLYRAK